MNNKLVYIPISFLALLSIVLLSLEFPNYGLLIGFVPLLITSIGLAGIFAGGIFIKYRSKMDGESIYALVGISMIFSFIFFLAVVSILNRKYATNNCDIASYNIVAFQGRYTSGYGNIEKGKIKANQWVLKVKIDGEIEQFVLEKDISIRNPVTRTMNLEFCQGIFGTKYLSLE